MVDWGPITPEQKEVYRHRLDHVYDIAITFLSNVLNATEFVKSEPGMVDIEEIDVEFREIVEENMVLYKKLREHRLKPIKFDKETIEDLFI